MLEHAADPHDVVEAVDRLVDECRVACLWFLRADYYPRTTAERVRVLQNIEHHATLEQFRRARALRRWLSRPSSERSAGS